MGRGRPLKYGEGVRTASKTLTVKESTLEYLLLFTGTGSHSDGLEEVVEKLKRFFPNGPRSVPGGAGQRIVNGRSKSAKAERTAAVTHIVRALGAAKAEDRGEVKQCMDALVETCPDCAAAKYWASVRKMSETERFYREVAKACKGVTGATEQPKASAVENIEATMQQVRGWHEAGEITTEEFRATMRTLVRRLAKAKEAK